MPLNSAVTIAIRIVLVALTATFLAAPSTRGATARDDCALCLGAKEIRCLTCEGSKVSAVPCPPCKGEGRYDCASCDKGRIDCLTRTCRDGVVTWSGRYGASKKDQDTCGFCKGKGTLACKACRSGKRTCGACKGRGEYRGPCPDCVGGGLLPCPLCAAEPQVGDCPWSKVSGAGSASASWGAMAETRDCRACKEGPEPRACLECEGSGAVFCRSCRGHTKLPCQRCGASGKMRSKFLLGGKAGVKAHEGCAGKGIVSCLDCKKGRVDCRKCDEGLIKSCVHCGGHRNKARCYGCADERHRPFELYGKHLYSEGHFAASADYYRVALESARRHFEALETAARVDLERAEKLQKSAAEDEKGAEQIRRARADAKQARTALSRARKDRERTCGRLQQALERARDKVPG